MAKKLKPIKPDKRLIKELEKIIENELYEAIFAPIMELFDEDDVKIENSLNLLKNAIMKGIVSYDGKFFRGKFSASVSKELRKMGATFNKHTKSWQIDQENLAPDFKVFLVAAENKFSNLQKNVVAALDNQKAVALITDIGDRFVDNFYRNLNQIDSKTNPELIKDIGVAPQLSEGNKRNIAKAYGENLALYVKDFVDKEVVELRQLVEQNTGARATSLKKIIAKRFGVSQRKAKFLAEQETRLSRAAYSEEKYKSAGITRYIWSTADDVRVRPGHEDLDQKVFYFSEPPIVDRKSGRRANPGQDFGCRCVAIPIVD